MKNTCPSRAGIHNSKISSTLTKSHYPCYHEFTTNMLSSSATKAGMISLLILGVLFWQTHGAANLHIKTMATNMNMSAKACSTSLPCLTAVHVSPIPFLPIIAIMAVIVLLLLAVTPDSSLSYNLQRLWLYSKKWRQAGGSTHLFDYLQNFLSQGLLQPKLAYTSLV